MKIEIKETLDGSLTLYLPALDEHYHSTFGAIQESMHVFIKAGFESCTGKELQILEIGFGTGLNCYLTLLESQKTDKRVYYVAVEKFPLDLSVWEQLNYGEMFDDSQNKFFPLIHHSPWNSMVKILPKFELFKVETDLLELDLKEVQGFDLVYFDAFSPDKQPELWCRSVFEMIYAKMKIKSILVTYCAKGNVRRLLQSVGFIVERIPGPPGKREMIRATKIGE